MLLDPFVLRVVGREADAGSVRRKRLVGWLAGFGSR